MNSQNINDLFRWMGPKFDNLAEAPTRKTIHIVAIRPKEIKILHGGFTALFHGTWGYLRKYVFWRLSFEHTYPASKRGKLVTFDMTARPDGKLMVSKLMFQSATIAEGLTGGLVAVVRPAFRSSANKQQQFTQLWFQTSIANN